jgi:hypothetical protein
MKTLKIRQASGKGNREAQNGEDDDNKKGGVLAP